MNRTRILGDNIKLLLLEKGITKERFSDALGYSISEVDKLCDGRLATTDEDVCDIALFFEVEKNDLFTPKKPETYVDDGFLHCIGQFKNEGNRDKILNIFDMYIDLLECIPCKN